jgi:hypothetical protein
MDHAVRTGRTEATSARVLVHDDLIQSWITVDDAGARPMPLVEARPRPVVSSAPPTGDRAWLAIGPR